jgi:hypothetical protein
MSYQSKFLIAISNLDYTRCISYCNSNPKCVYVLFKMNKCFLCDTNAMSYLSLTVGVESVLFKKDLNDGFFNDFFLLIFKIISLIINCF